MFYQQITLIDQCEVPSYAIWSKLYKKLHLALVESKKREGDVHIGVSFPDYVYDGSTPKGKKWLGNKLRLIARSERELRDLNINQWLKNLVNGDYVHITSIRSVPTEIKSYACYGRKQTFNQSYIARLQRRANTRNKEESSLASTTLTDLPHVQLESYSTSTELEGQRHGFTLHIEKKLVDKNENFVFSTYGLSSESALPEF